MSHCFGVMCADCRTVIVTDSCPERGCSGHGYTHTTGHPDHECEDKG